MKHIFSAGLLFAFMLMAFNTKSPADLPIGADMPKAEIKLKDVSGKEISLKDAKKEKGLLVMFSCNTCPVVVKNQARTKEICAYAKEKGLGVILLNSNEAQRDSDDSYADMQEYAKNQGYDWYYAVDKNNVLADAFGATKTPECFVFDKGGKLVYHGAIDDNAQNPSEVNRKHLKVAIDELVSGKDIEVKKSRSVGCSIKRI